MNAFRLLLACLLFVQGAQAAPVVLGSSTIEIPAPQGFVAITPDVGALWSMVQAAQGDKHILAFYIPQTEQSNARAGKPADFSRNINVQTGRKFEAAILTPTFFGQMKVQLKAMMASRQIDAIQAKELERLNGNIEKAIELNPKLAQIENATLAPHVDLADQFGYSEISMEQATRPDGTVSRSRVTATAMSILVKGKILNCYVTGGADDLAWTRSIAKQWVDALISANRN